MARKVAHRLPAVKTLYDMLPKGAEGGKEFARLVDLLLYHEGRRTNKKIGLFSDVAGDYHGLDSFAGDSFRKEGTTGYQYKFFPSPLKDAHRKAIIESLERTEKSQKELKLKKWILVTPENLIESARRKGGGDVTWFEGLRKKLGLKFELEHWGHNHILALFLETPSLCLFYYPELVADGAARRKTIQETRGLYDENLIKLYGDIQFVGMNVRKQEATKGVPMEHIYIPLTVIPEAADEQDPNTPRTDPRTLLSQNTRRVILGDPGSGKSTLLRFLTLAGISEPLQQRYNAEPDERLPIFITLRRYADELKTRANLSLIKYIQESVQADFNLNSADQEFFEYYLESGQAMLFFDGLDELPGSHFKEKVRDQIRTLITSSPGNTTIVTSRIVGYDNPFRFDEKEFTHHRLTRLRLPEMKQFVEDWYRVRIENERDRSDHVQSLVRILENPEQKAIYDLAENPLLLTIIALVHRIDGVLPDARVVLYKICTETLLESWHRWKFRDLEAKNRGREERRNKQRMEAIAQWMQTRSVGTGKTQRAVVPYADLSKFLTAYIKTNEKQVDPNDEPEDLANEFLRFVKKRAGLLVELGDNQYSFVHLTFQEYLTASYIKTNSELEGIAKTWENIKEIFYEPRWHEVIRLLIAGLDSNASQQFLVERILAHKANGQQSAKAQLLGGLLLDGVEAAEEHEGDILRELLEASIGADDVEQLRPTNTLLNSWLTKESPNEESLCEAFAALSGGRVTKQQKLNLTLVAAAIGLPKEKQLELADKFFDSDSVDADIFYLLFGDRPVAKTSPNLIQRIAPLWATQDYYALISAISNFIAAVCQSITGFMSPEIAANRLFEGQLVSLAGSTIEVYGPFRHFAFRSSLFIQEAPAIHNLLARRTLTRDMSNARVLFNAVRQSIGPKASENENLSRESVMNRAKLRMKFMEQRQDVIGHLTDRSFLMMEISGSEDFGAEFFSNPNIYTRIINTLCDTLKLEPRGHWWEALRVDFIPRIQYRVPQFNGNTWSKVEASFDSDTADEAEEFLAAWLLFFDSWLYIHQYYASPEDSPFGNLAVLTRDSVAPALNIAHCIRDLAFGDESRIDDFVMMVSSDEPAYRSIFERCHFRDAPDEKGTRPRKVTRKPAKKAKKVSRKK
jgi:hypothetical protein